MKKIGFIIGRFQPLHSGHKSMIRQASKMFDYVVIIVGSAQRSRTMKNPWTLEEREDKIIQFLNFEGLENCNIHRAYDSRYCDNLWRDQIKRAIFTWSLMFNADPVLAGYTKDGNDYLKWFPEIEYQELKQEVQISATEVREHMLKHDLRLLPLEVVQEAKYYEDEAKKFSVYPYPETLNFVCADVVLVCQGRVALIERKNYPGKGAWALPGGFKNNNETTYQCALREAKEEVGVDLEGLPYYRNSVYDDPTRSPGIPRITTAFLFRLESFPELNAADDAAKVQWFKFEDLKNIRMHDDHFDILHDMLQFPL